MNSLLLFSFIRGGEVVFIFYRFLLFQSKGYTRGVTKPQFARMLHFLSINVQPQDLAVSQRIFSPSPPHLISSLIHIAVSFDIFDLFPFTPVKANKKITRFFCSFYARNSNILLEGISTILLSFNPLTQVQSYLYRKIFWVQALSSSSMRIQL